MQPTRRDFFLLESTSSITFSMLQKECLASKIQKAKHRHLIITYGYSCLLKHYSIDFDILRLQKHLYIKAIVDREKKNDVFVQLGFILGFIPLFISINEGHHIYRVDIIHRCRRFTEVIQVIYQENDSRRLLNLSILSKCSLPFVPISP